MRTGALCLAVTALLATACNGTPEVSLQQVGTGFARTTANTCVFRGSSIASNNEWRATAFYDSESFINIAWQKAGSDEWTVTRTQYQGKTSDAHDIISLAIDGKGYLHVAFSMHSSPMLYCRSIEPYSSVLGPLENMVNADEEQKATYPEFHRLSNGDLIFFYRNGASGNGNLVLNHYCLDKGQWERVQDVLIDGEGLRNAYPQMYVDAKDVIHLSWVWRETPKVETNHDMCYACSRDAGKTWQRTDGTAYQMPINAESAEYACLIPQCSELMNQTSMTSDSEGHPYIATYWRDADSKVPQYRLVWHDGANWQSSQVGNLTTEFTLAGGGTKKVPISRPQVAVNGNGVFFIFRAEEFGSVVSAFHTASLKDTKWTRYDLTDFSVESWEPTLDRDALKRDGNIAVFVQRTAQGDGEKMAECPPQPVYVMDVK